MTLRLYGLLAVLASRVFSLRGRCGCRKEISDFSVTCFQQWLASVSRKTWNHVLSLAEQVLGDARSFGAARLRSNGDLEHHHYATIVPINTLLTRHMLFLDGKTHQQLKQVLLPHFQTRAENSLKEHIHIVEHTLLALYTQAACMDLVKDFAGPSLRSSVPTC